MNKLHPNLPQDNQAVVRLIQSHLAKADLFYVRFEDVSEALDVPFNTILCRLRKTGTNWETLKRQERTRRLMENLDLLGRKNINGVARQCGYAGNESFLMFFKRVMGKTFTQWRLDRQGGDLCL